VHYFVRRQTLVNVVAVVERESWTGVVDRPGRPREALAAFDGWHPQVRSMLRSVEETVIWALWIYEHDAARSSLT
jgi:salicylate hydroxylase